MTYRWLRVAAILLITVGTSAAQTNPRAAAARDFATVSAKMKHLEPLLGDWTADVQFIGKDGKISHREGTYSIRYTLDQTYQQWDITFRNPQTGNAQSMLLMITFNPVTGKYDLTYFYSRYAPQVREVGEFDTKTNEFRTTAFIPREDGVRDEHIRTVTRISAKPEYLHYNRYSDEKEERLGVRIIMERKK
jgi:hypothetical protein